MSLPYLWAERALVQIPQVLPLLLDSLWGQGQKLVDFYIHLIMGSFFFGRMLSSALGSSFG